MPDSRYYITHYTKYFNLKAPSSVVQVMMLLLIGAVSGSAMSFIIHYQVLWQEFSKLLVSGFSTGMLVISLPALLTVVFIKAVKRKMLIKHAMFATIIITIFYAMVLIIDSAIFYLSNSAAVAYIVLLLANACVYGYWFIMGRIVIGRGKSAAAIAATQPVLNILFYIPLGRYILDLGVPLNITLVKLLAGMLVFLVAGHEFLYVVDRPAKRILNISGVKLIASMISQWLYGLTIDAKVIGQGVGERRDLSIDVLAIRGNEGYKAVFLNPDIHFGPFAGVGGSVAPAWLGNVVVERQGCAPFIVHSPLTLKDNPISTMQVHSIEKELGSVLANGRMRFRKAYGSIREGKSNSCRAINIALGDSGLLLLTRAPKVTEDMDREIGVHFKDLASDSGNRNVMVINAHNSRFESASAKELEELHQGNLYIREYEAAIKNAIKPERMQGLRLGAAYDRISKLLGSPKDIGDGYTSVCVFEFGSKRFGLVYFDANNMLPGFRNKLIEHIKSKFGVRVEVCTTDTHSINSIDLAASNSLGRYTGVEKVIPIIDSMMRSAIQSMEPVMCAYKKIKISNFAVWGKEADILIESTSREVKRMLKYVAPLLGIATFIIAAWVIYIV